MNEKFREKLESLLKQDERFYLAEKDHFFRNKVTECANNLDKNLIDLLLSDVDCKANFFKLHQVGKNEITIFDKDSFIFWINSHEFLPDSYTKFKQNIGLSLDGNKLLRQNKDVALIFPYKDCILQGGQTNEETKRNEIFYNEVLAPDQIDRLLDKKVLCNFKKITADGEQSLKEIKNLTQQNLIIKGNNLLALHSLKQIYRGKVKLIYIDPPYNTGGDANIFTYNNSFNHSTWLTFMKNRLEIAKELLRDDGIIAIAIDHNELFYLGVLADEIFGRENRLGNITVIHHPAGKTNDKHFATTNEYMLIYAKNEFNTVLNNFEISEEKKKYFNKEDEISEYKLENLIRKGETRNARRIDRPKQFYPIYVNENLKEITLDKKLNYIEILPIENNIEWIWSFSPSYLQENIEKGNIVAKKIKDKIRIFYKRRIIDYKGKKPTTTWKESKYNASIYGTKLLKKLLPNENFSYPKSLYTVLDTLKIITDKDDIIMDFHAGSGTTGHAVLELNKEDGGNRKFVLVEQLEKHIAICKERIQKVMQNYIKEVLEKPASLLADEKNKLKENYFITFELAEYNQKFIPQIEQAKNTKELLTIYDSMKNNGFLSYQFSGKDDDKDFADKQKNFENLTLAKQKQILMELLDKNMLYLNYEDIEDSKYNVSPQTIKLNKAIYTK